MTLHFEKLPAVFVAEVTGVDIPEVQTLAADTVRPMGQDKAGFAGLFGKSYIFPTLVLGFMSATGLLLVYSLNTWLPELMLRAGFNAKGSLSFLLVLNGGAPSSSSTRISASR